MVTVILVMITGDVSSASGLIFAIPALLLELAYSREFETEADDFAYEFLIKHSISPQYFADVMRKIMQLEPSGQHEPRAQSEQVGKSETNHREPYFSTHPDTEQRIQRFLQ